jgi:hypothetical protein
VRGIEEAVQPAIEGGRARGEIEGHGDGDGGGDLVGCLLASLAQPLEDDVAAQRHAGEADRGAGRRLDQAPQHEIEIGGLARVIEPAQPVELAAARAEVDDDPAPAGVLHQAHQAQRVVRLG